MLGLRVDYKSTDAAAVAEFEREFTLRNVQRLRVFTPIGVVLTLGYVPWDYLLGAKYLGFTVAVRTALSLSLVGLFVWAKQPGFVVYHDRVVFGLTTAAGLSFALIFFTVPDGLVAGVGGLCMLIMYGAGAVWMPGGLTLLSGLVTTVTVTILSLLAEISTPLLVGNAMILVSVTCLASLYNSWSRQTSWRLFLNERRLRDEMARSTEFERRMRQMREERLGWLENVVRFLRHELKNQMTAAATSVDLARNLATVTEPSESGLLRLHDKTPGYLERAQKSLTHMRHLVESATEATSLEAALATEQLVNVNLSELVSERVATFGQSHPGLRIRAEIATTAFVQGSETRLTQLLDKLLGNARQHVSSKGYITVSVVHEHEGEVALRVENEGVALPRDKEAIFRPFVSTAKTTDNLGLGLYVVKVIADGHNATVRAYDLDDPQGAGFEVAFPKPA